MKEAVKYYKEAARFGFRLAQFDLAICYLNGDGVKQNFEKAIRSLEKAAAQDLDEAENVLQKLREDPELAVYFTE
ncbi:MAG: SEL1-like repeat protein [Parachlamydiaceae bacterium]|nr:MAG: SEL1-like repeat protein [Parachlamydiaceae bacterium]